MPPSCDDRARTPRTPFLLSAPTVPEEVREIVLDKPTPKFHVGYVKKPKLSPEVQRALQELGRQGGKARARKHSKAELSKWGKKGGRPRKKKT